MLISKLEISLSYQLSFDLILLGIFVEAFLQSLLIDLQLLKLDLLATHHLILHQSFVLESSHENFLRTLFGLVYKFYV